MAASWLTSPKTSKTLPELAHTLHQLARSCAAQRGLEDPFLARFPDNKPRLDLHPCTPEALGDHLENLRGPARAQAFQALIAGDTRAQGQQGLSTTQRFTPAWLAQWMATQSARLQTPSPEAPCLDPACGGGRLLLSMLDVLLDQGISPADVLPCLVGFDLDPLAVQVTRHALWIKTACQPGASPDTLPCPLIFQTPLQDPLGALASWDSLAALSPLPMTPGAFGVVLSNPPYMGTRHLAPELRDKLRRNFGAFSGDLYTAFLRRCLDLCAPDGALAILCQQSFLFIKRDRALRQQWFDDAQPHKLLHLGPHAFPGLKGEKAAVVAILAKKTAPSDTYPLEITDLHDLHDADAKAQTWQAVEDGQDPDKRRIHSTWALQQARRGEPLAYWAGSRMQQLLRSDHTLGSRLDIPGAPNKTADNTRFLRWWWETSPEDPWRPYAKGGPRKMWYGNLERVIDWSQQARDHYGTWRTANLLHERYWNREGLTWSDFGGHSFCARQLPSQGIFDMTGPSAFIPENEDRNLWFWLGLLNGSTVCHLLNARNATIHYQVGDLRRLPLPQPEAWTRQDLLDSIEQLARRGVTLAKQLASYNPRDPLYHKPLLAQVYEDHTPRDLTHAIQCAHHKHQETHRALDALQHELDEAVRQLYDLPAQELQDQQRRARPPQPHRRKKDQVLGLEALDWLLGLTQGRYGTHKDATPTDWMELGQQVGGDDFQALCPQFAGADTKVVAQVLRYRQKLYKDKPWHPSRQSWAWKDPR